MESPFASIRAETQERQDISTVLEEILAESLGCSDLERYSIK